MSMEYPCVYFEKDGKCRKFSDDTVISYCVMGPCSEQKPSNADHIRAMSDQELADFIDDWWCAGANGDESYATHEARLAWLQALAKEDT